MKEGARNAMFLAPSLRFGLRDGADEVPSMNRGLCRSPILHKHGVNGVTYRAPLPGSRYARVSSIAMDYETLRAITGLSLSAGLAPP